MDAPTIVFPSATTPWKYLSLYGAAGILFFGFLLIAFAFVNASYSPFKSKQLNSLAVGWVAHVFYVLAAATSLQFVDPTGVFTNCNFWFMYAYGLLGVSLAALVMAYRMYRLYYLIVLNKYPKGFPFYYVLFLSYLPMLALTVISTLMPGLFITEVPIVQSGSNDGVPGCVMTSNAVAMVFFVAVLIQLAHLWILTFQVSKIGSSFNEFKENITISTVFTLLWIATTGLVVTGLSYEIWGKLVIFWLTVVAGALVWALPLIPVTIGFLFNRKRYLEEFRMGLRAEYSPSKSKFSSVRMSTL